MLTNQGNRANGKHIQSQKQSNVRRTEEKYGAETQLDLLPSHIPSSLTQLYAQIER